MNTKELTRKEAEEIVNNGGRVVVEYHEKGYNFVADKDSFYTSKKITDKARYFIF